MRAVSYLRLGLLLSLVVAVGCASENKGKIEGKKWRSYSSVVKGRSVPDGGLWLSFKKDGGLDFRAGAENYSGKYTLGPGKMVILNLDRDLAGRKSHTETVEISGGRLTMTDSDGTQMTFYEDQ